MMVSPGWAALIAFWIDSPGPTTLFAACAEPIAVARATPLATKRVRIMVATSSMVRLIKRPPLCRGAKEERCCKTIAPLRNEGSILLTEGDVCALWHKAYHSTKEAPNFRELRLGDVGQKDRPGRDGYSPRGRHVSRRNASLGLSLGQMQSLGGVGPLGDPRQSPSNRISPSPRFGSAKEKYSSARSPAFLPSWDGVSAMAVGRSSTKRRSHLLSKPPRRA